MPRFAANLSMMYTEFDFLDRFAAAAQDGFRYVEFLFPYDFAPEVVAARLREAGLRQALFNLPPGDWAAGERGMAAIPGREAEFLRSVDQARRYADALDPPNLHAMSGRIPHGADPVAMRRTLVSNLRTAARAVAEDGRTLLIEPLNTRDNPGYFLTTQEQAQALLADVGEPNLKIQFDLYHCQIMQGDLIHRMKHGMDGIGHIQIAGVPDRHEPDTGELSLPGLCAALDGLGYAGVVGCEYRPRQGTRAGLGWFAPWRDQQG